MSDLLERLRKVETGMPDFIGDTTPTVSTCWYRNPDGPEAADEIARLQADYRECCDELQRVGLLMADTETEIERLQAVVDAAVGVIEEIRSAAKAGRLPAGAVQRMVNEALERYDYLMDGEVKP